MLSTEGSLARPHTCIKITVQVVDLPSPTLTFSHHATLIAIWTTHSRIEFKGPVDP